MGGGLAIYGGVIGGLLGGILMAKIRKINILAMLDLGVLGFLIGQGIGRWGNLSIRRPSAWRQASLGHAEPEHHPRGL